jgi:hypothetical protein
MAAFVYANNYDDGGLNLIGSSSGSPAAVAAPSGSKANYAIELSAAEHVALRPGALVLLPSGSITSPTKCTAKLYITDVTPAAAVDFLWFGSTASGTDSERDLTLRLRTDGDVEIRSA